LVKQVLDLLPLVGYDAAQQAVFGLQDADS